MRQPVPGVGGAAVHLQAVQGVEEQAQVKGGAVMATPGLPGRCSAMVVLEGQRALRVDAAGQVAWLVFFFVSVWKRCLGVLMKLCVV